MTIVLKNPENQSIVFTRAEKLKEFDYDSDDYFDQKLHSRHKMVNFIKSIAKETDIHLKLELDTFWKLQFLSILSLILNRLKIVKLTILGFDYQLKWFLEFHPMLGKRLFQIKTLQEFENQEETVRMISKSRPFMYFGDKKGSFKRKHSFKDFIELTNEFSF